MIRLPYVCAHCKRGMLIPRTEYGGMHPMCWLTVGRYLVG